MQNYRGGGGARPRSSTGPFENRYHALYSDSNDSNEVWQMVGNSRGGKGKYKWLRRSTGGTNEHSGQFEDLGLGFSEQYKIMGKDEFRSL